MTNESNINKSFYSNTHVNDEKSGFFVNNINIFDTQTGTNDVSTPFFSLCISVYNQEKYIERCLLSILNQKFRNIEVVVVDDKSNDGSLKIIEKFQKEDNRIKVIRNKINLSLQYSRIVALKEIKGEYVLFVDPDDYLEKDSLEALFYTLKNRNINMLEFSYCEEPSKRIVSYDIYIYDLTEQILSNKYPHTVWNKCYSKKLILDSLKDAQQFYCNISEDRYFSTLFSLNIKEGFLRTDQLVYHYSNSDGISNSKDFNFDRLKNAIKSLKNKDDALYNLLINKEKKEYLDYFLDQSRFDLMFVFRLCVNSSDKFINKIKNTIYIDKSFGSHLFFVYFPIHYFRYFFNRFIRNKT